MLDGFRSRLVLSNLLITLFGFLVVVAIFLTVLINRSTDVKKADRQAQANNLAAQVHDQIYVPHKTSPDLKAFVDMASRILQARIIIVRPDGSYYADSAEKTPYYTGTWRPLDRSALESGRAARVAVSSNHLYRFQAPIRGRIRANGGAVLLIVRVTEVTPSVVSLAGIILLAVGTALFIWLLLSLYFTYSVFRPLLQITSATDRMARGDYNVRVPIHGDGEIARLARSFNTMAAHVQRSNQVLKDFVANVSHDLRTPLTMIAGFSEAILDGTAGPGETEASAAIIHEEAGKMQRLVEDLLQLTRLESRLLTLERRPVVLHEFVQRTLERAERAVPQLPALQNRVPPDLPPADVDPMQLERAIRNLLENAIQYTPPGGTVTVGAEPAGRGWIEISVSDTGSGISRDELPRIFERFYRSDKGRERVHGHSGLGLAIVQEIVQAHGGRVSVESEPGAGTTFRLTVPQAIGAPAEPRREGAATW